MHIPSLELAAAESVAGRLFYRPRGDNERNECMCKCFNVQRSYKSENNLVIKHLLNETNMKPELRFNTTQAFIILQVIDDSLLIYSLIVEALPN